MSECEWTLKVALDAAAILIEGAGLKLKHTSSSGSRYYHLSGRLGLLRLADHCKETTADVTAMLIINVASMPRDERRLRRMVAEAIGRYMLNTEVKTAPVLAVMKESSTLYTVVYEVTGDRAKHDFWWRMIFAHDAADGIRVKATASFDALAKLERAQKPPPEPFKDWGRVG